MNKINFYCIKFLLVIKNGDKSLKALKYALQVFLTYWQAKTLFL